MIAQFGWPPSEFLSMTYMEMQELWEDAEEILKARG
jgi:hypothetical protein